MLLMASKRATGVAKRDCAVQPGQGEGGCGGNPGHGAHHQLHGAPTSQHPGRLPAFPANLDVTAVRAFAASISSVCEP